MSESTSQSENTERIWKTLEQYPIWMFTTVGSAGLHARPMAVTADRTENAIWLISSVKGRKTEEVAKDADASLSLMEGALQVAVSGRAEVTDDRAKLKQIWSTGAQAFFPDGPDDPDVTLVKVRPTRAELWDGDGPLASAIKMTTAVFTKQPPDLGDHAQADLRRRIS